MEIEEKRLKGVFEITLKPNLDERGYFMRTFDDKIFEKAGINYKWVQENHARTERENILRGLHFQLPPYCETKMVRSVLGAVLDVFVDLRKDSHTFGQWGSIVLSDENKKMILIPRGFAHGYRTLTDISEVLYKVDNYYHPESESGVLWNDKDLKIEWGLIDGEEPVLSEKDRRNISFQEFKDKYGSI